MNFKNMSLSTTITISAVLLIFSTCLAKNYYVDATNGNDDNNGLNSIQAWKTIAKINSFSFTSGDSIFFRRGDIWHEQLSMTSSGSEGNPISFGAYSDGDKPVIDGNNNTWGLVLLEGQNYITFTNLTLKNSAQHAVKTGESPSDYIIFENCSFQDNGGCAISGSPGCDHWIIRNNFIVNCGEPQDNDSIYLNDGTTYWEIYNNRIYNSGGDDIALAGSGHRIYRNDLGPSISEAIGVSSDAGSNDIWIYENKIHGHDFCGIVVKGTNFKIFRNKIYDNGEDGGIFINNDEVTGLAIYQNLIWGHHNGYSGIALWRGGNNTTIYNNVIYDNDNGISIQQNQQGVEIINNIIRSNVAVGIDADDSSPIISHNNVHNNGTNYSGSNDRIGMDGNISQDPKFKNESGYDFALQATSPCIGAGKDVGLTEDFNGAPLPQGRGFDIGAFEYIVISPPKNIRITHPNPM